MMFENYSCLPGVFDLFSQAMQHHQKCMKKKEKARYDYKIQIKKSTENYILRKCRPPPKPVGL